MPFYQYSENVPHPVESSLASLEVGIRGEVGMLNVATTPAQTQHEP